jgi:transposase, IS30 family
VQRCCPKKGELRYYEYPAPAKKRNTSLKYQQLSQEERYIIIALLKTHISLAEIGRQLNRSTSTISRELSRNKRPTGYYAAFVAHEYAIARRHKSRRGSQFSEEQWQIILFLLRLDFSPEQISNTLKRFALFSISHETIYQYLLYDKKKGGTWYKHLRFVPKRRRKRYNSHDSRGRLDGKRYVSERPTYINNRSEVGHWEGDTVIGSDRRHCIVTLVERKTGFVIIKKITARTAEQVTTVCIQAIKEHQQMFKTITFDNGTEFHSYKEIEAQTSVKCYFAAPYHSWERGTNENTNGLIRQYLPKKSCMKNITQADCDRIAYRLNTRPRKRHCYKTPEELYYGKDSALHLLLELRYLLFNTM